MFHLLKKIIRKKDEILFQYLKRKFCHFSLDEILSKLLTEKNFNSNLVVQIGAYDGLSGDPIYQFLARYPVKAILLEPQKKIFENLKKNYQDIPTVRCVNAALDSEDGYRTIFKISDEIKCSKIAKFFEDIDIAQLTSFSKETILKESHRSEELINYIISEKIATISVSSMKKIYEFNRIDVLVIDTEGYDFEIIKMFFKEGFYPKIIFFESKHLLFNDYLLCIKQLMFKNNYRISQDEGGNTLAVKADFL
jgi:FkbM family methyltransferase